MSQLNLGRLEQVSLRQVWQHEAHDFTKWLSKAENIAYLQEELDLSFTDVKVEDSAGSFSVDITAEDTEGRKVIIENQLESTDHKHLGQLLTYASAFDASVIIWVVKDYRDEHKQAVDWFNRHMPEAISFFLVKLELWQIGDSLPAPKFNIVSQPNEWTKIVKQANTDSTPSETKLKQQEFWESFKDYVSQHDGSIHLGRSARQSTKFRINLDTSEAIIALNANFQKQLIACDVYIKRSREYFDMLKEQREEIEGKLGYQLDYRDLPEQKGFRLAKSYEIDPSNRDNWQECFQWLMERTREFKEVFPPYFKQ